MRNRAKCLLLADLQNKYGDYRLRDDECEYLAKLITEDLARLIESSAGCNSCQGCDWDMKGGPACKCFKSISDRTESSESLPD